MIRIFFKTIWNQRSRNILIFLEFFLIYVVLSNLSIFYTDMISIKLIPNCYHFEDVVKIKIYSKGDGSDENHLGTHILNLKRALSMNEYVESVSVSQWATPFNYNLASNSYKYNDENVNVAIRNVDPEYSDVFKINPVKGRWFDDTDIGKKVEPAVISRMVEDETFGGDAIGKRFGEDDEEYEVIGVTDEFKRSDIEKPYGNMFRLLGITGEKTYNDVTFQIRIKPGHVSDFLNVANREIFSVLNDDHWTIGSINTLENQRMEQNDNSRIKRLIVLLIAIFVMLNIVLGVIGILWYNTNLRTHEIGIKKAMGSHGKRITRHIVLESLIIAVLSSIPVIIILAQAEGLRIAPVKGDLFLLSQLIAFVIMIVLVIICTWLPSKLASDIHPATALKYE
jgi:putative ABC transport system permease protein